MSNTKYRFTKVNDNSRHHTIKTYEVYKDNDLIGTVWGGDGHWSGSPVGGGGTPRTETRQKAAESVDHFNTNGYPPRGW